MTSINELKSSQPPARKTRSKTDGRSKRKTGRTTQLNTRVTVELREGMHERAEKAGVTFGRLFELMMGRGTVSSRVTRKAAWRRCWCRST